MVKKFLIGQLASYGDCLYATTLARQIKNDYPGSHITWAVSSRYKSILELNPHVDAVWEIPREYGDLFGEAWYTFKKEAFAKKDKGEFDEIILSQIAPRWVSFNGTIRGTILSAYNKPITVSRDPVVFLSPAEIHNVQMFAEKHELKKYKQVVLFECSPTSGQNKNVTPEWALGIAKKIIRTNPTTCLILSTPHPMDTGSPQIIDASGLTFRENAELTKYCDLLIGCSSGITWISTSTWAKKLPMIQILDPSFLFYYGIAFDHHLNHLDDSRVLEILTFSEATILNAISLALEDKFIQAKELYHEEYKVTEKNFGTTVFLFLKYKHFLVGIPLLWRYKRLYPYLSLPKLFFNYIKAHFLLFALIIRKSKVYLRKSKVYLSR